jgi:hypothetical protein
LHVLLALGCAAAAAAAVVIISDSVSWNELSVPGDSVAAPKFRWKKNLFDIWKNQKKNSYSQTP